MTDFFGIDNAVKGAVQVYFQSARRSGRTTRMVEAAQTGDRIVFHDKREANRVRKLCLDLGKDVACEVRARVSDIYRRTGRTFFDHGWLEKYYTDSINEASWFMSEINPSFDDPEPPVPFRRF